MSEPLLEIASLRAGYGAVPVLFGVSLTIARGEIVALVGSNGAGKTTLLRAISRTIAAESEAAAAFDRVYGLFPVLGERRRQLAGSLSGGEQQMCALARALMAAPVLLMVDEMSLGLAPVIVDQLLGILADIRKEGVTVLLVEQDVFAAFSIADRGYVMETGQVVREGRASDLANDPEVRRAYLGVA
jgi:branched-chain amino acid transport system ATP-binding protein